MTCAPFAPLRPMLLLLGLSERGERTRRPFGAKPSESSSANSDDPGRDCFIMNRTDLSLNGTSKDVMSFFHVSLKTVNRWVEAGELGCWKENGHRVFLEQDVVRKILNGYKGTEKAMQHEREAQARQAWAKHLFLRRIEEVAELREQARRLADKVEALAMAIGVANPLEAAA